MVSVTAKPLIGPVPNWNRKSAETIVVTLESMMVAKARWKPRSTADAHGLAELQLLADALEDQHVGVDRHADGQDHAGDAGQRERGLEGADRAEQEDDVEDQGDDGVDARALVVDEHEDDDQDQPDHAGPQPADDRVAPERRADRPLLEVGDRGRQRAGAQHQRQVLGALRC